MVDVTVSLQGAAKSGPAGVDGPIQMSLPDATTVGDLLRAVAEKLAEPLRSALLPSGPGLPTRLRLFVDGQLAQGREQPIARTGARRARVVVVLASPVSGGA